MDTEPQQPTSTNLPSSSSSSTTTTTAITNTERTLRSRARGKQLQQHPAKEKDSEVSANEDRDSSASASRATRSRTSVAAVAGSKRPNTTSTSTRISKRTRRATQPPTASALIINEPTRDPKGKKRALPESISDDESTAAPSSSIAKKLRSTPASIPPFATTTTTTSSSTPYALRSRKDPPTHSSPMPKKSKSSTSPKSKTNFKGKSSSALAGPGPSRLEDDDDIMDVDYAVDDHDHDHDHDHAHADFDDEDDDGGDEHDAGDGFNADDAAAVAALAAATSAATGGGGGASTNADPHSAASTFSMFSDFGRLGGYMSQLSARLRTLLTNLKPTADPTTRLVALQELSELLSISTEDTLAGSFQVEAFVRELVRILGGNGGQAAQDGDDGDDDDDDEGSGEQDEDAALAAALAMSSGGNAGDENLEAQLLACRCLANLMEALPGCGHTLVYHGAIPVLCSKLLEISYIDLAEQTLLTLEKISEEYPSAIVREGGLAALLNYLDFFSIAVQRTALQAAANCTRNASPDHFPQILAAWPTILSCLSYSDARLVDFAALCVIRVVDAYQRSHAGLLEQLVGRELIRAVVGLLLPAGGGGAPLVPSGTYTLLVRALATAARASPTVAVSLLDEGIVTTIYQILTGVLPPENDETMGEEQGGDGVEGGQGQGLGGGVADMAVMQNLAHRPKEQVEEALNLVSELMPPLPKDGTFDHKGYSEKALHRMIKAKAKADRAAARAANGTAVPASVNNAQMLAVAGASTPSAAPSRAQSPAGTPAEDDAPSSADIHDGPITADPDFIPPPSMILSKDGLPGSSSTAAKEGTAAAVAAVDRAALLRANAPVVNRFIHLVVPILVDVYAASVSVPVRIKSLTALLKAVCFLDAEGLSRTLRFAPIASFLSSILSSKDHPHLMVGALQMVELLLAKAPAEYTPSFRREGVLHEVEMLAARPLPPKAKDKEKEKDKEVVMQTRDAPVLDVTTPPGEQSDSGPAVVMPPVPAAFIGAVGGVVIGGGSGSSSKRPHLVDPEDAYTLRARVIRFKYLSGEAKAEGDATFTRLRSMVDALARDDASEEELRGSLREMAGLFAAVHTSVSSFELLQSGLVDGLLEFASVENRDVSLKRRQKLLLEELLPRRSKGVVAASTPFAVLVKKLQESLTRMETFEVSTVTPGIEDTKRSSPSLLARQIRLRLVAAEGSDTPRGCNNIIVSIHAIATFQALNDYLRPRLSGLLSTMGGSRLSGVLAALTGRLPPGALHRGNMEAAGEQGGSMPGPPAPELAAATASSSNAGEEKPGRRRSLRLSAKASTSSLKDAQPSVQTPAPAFEAAPPPAKEEVNAETAASETAVNDEDDGEDDYMDADVDADVFDDDMDNDDSMAEKTVTLSVADDGSKVEAQTPDGTRVTTPNPTKDSVPAPTTGSSVAKASYAAALKNKQTDWHLEFSMDEHTLPLDLTVYGAVHQHEARKTSGQPLPLNLIWQNVYTVKYKKVSGPPPTSESRQDSTDVPSRARSPGLSLSSLPEDAPHAKILRLLRVLHKLNSQVADHVGLGGQQGLPETGFINNKLTAKLTRQLEEPMIVASSCLPDWAVDLPVHFPFLFPLGARFSFLQSTSFGYARLILKWQSQQNRAQDGRRDDTFGFLGRLQRQKVRISRKHILESAFKVFELYGSSSSILEVEYFDEVGTGLGPTLEFYSLVSREFARRDLKIWRDDSTHPGPYVHHPNGLFPAPLSPADIANDGGQKRTQVFRVIGQFVAKAMLDSRIIDMMFNKVFLKLILGEDVPLTIASLKLVDAGLATSLLKLQGFCEDDDEDDEDCPKRQGLITVSEPRVSVDDLALDFTIPGYDIELRPNGQEIPVTSANVGEYIHEVIDAIIGKGAELQAKAFREGFSKVFPVSDLQTFTADELVILFGSAEEDWSIETLTEAMKADHGFNVESRAIRDLLEIMSHYDKVTRRDFLQFITGSPKLPIGGFRALNPPLTVVRKPHEAPLTADDYLPSVMTCVNYLKLPEYSSKAVMREKLKIAMQEGVGSFHLS